jgi:hypothetical protein
VAGRFGIEIGIEGRLKAKQANKQLLRVAAYVTAIVLLHFFSPNET